MLKKLRLIITELLNKRQLLGFNLFKRLDLRCDPFKFGLALSNKHQLLLLFLLSGFNLSINKVTLSNSFELFLFEIHNIDFLYNGRIKNKFIMIDRENAGKYELSPEEENTFYVIEAVSMQNENLAKGKYVTANSKGKDAADLLTVLMLYEIGKIPDATTYLITNDHYGVTLKGIFEPLGVNIICHGKEFTDCRMPSKNGAQNIIYQSL